MADDINLAGCRNQHIPGFVNANCCESKYSLMVATYDFVPRAMALIHLVPIPEPWQLLRISDGGLVMMRETQREGTEVIKGQGTKTSKCSPAG
jgi:hypothetical protein